MYKVGYKNWMWIKKLDPTRMLWQINTACMKHISEVPPTSQSYTTFLFTSIYPSLIIWQKCSGYMLHILWIHLQKIKLLYITLRAIPQSIFSTIFSSIPWWMHSSCFTIFPDNLHNVVIYLLRLDDKFISSNLI